MGIVCILSFLLIFGFGFSALIFGEDSGVAGAILGTLAAASLVVAIVSGVAYSQNNNRGYNARCHAEHGKVVDLDGGNFTVCLNPDKTINYEVGFNN